MPVRSSACAAMPSSRKPNATVADVLRPFDPPVRATAQALRRLIKETIPTATEHPYAGWKGNGYRDPQAGISPESSLSVTTCACCSSTGRRSTIRTECSRARTLRKCAGSSCVRERPCPMERSGGSAHRLAAWEHAPVSPPLSRLGPKSGVIACYQARPRWPLQIPRGSPSVQPAPETCNVGHDRGAGMSRGWGRGGGLGVARVSKNWVVMGLGDYRGRGRPAGGA